MNSEIFQVATKFVEVIVRDLDQSTYVIILSVIISYYYLPYRNKEELSNLRREMAEMDPKTEARFDAMDARIDALDAKTEARIDALEVKLVNVIHSIIPAIRAENEPEFKELKDAQQTLTQSMESLKQNM